MVLICNAANKHSRNVKINFQLINYTEKVKVKICVKLYYFSNSKIGK